MKSNCANEILSKKEVSEYQAYKEKSYDNIDCQLLSKERDSTFEDKVGSVKSIVLLGYPVNSESRYCEYIHKVKPIIEEEINMACYRPSFFKQ